MTADLLALLHGLSVDVARGATPHVVAKRELRLAVRHHPMLPPLLAQGLLYLEAGLREPSAATVLPAAARLYAEALALAVEDEEPTAGVWLQRFVRMAADMDSAVLIPAAEQVLDAVIVGCHVRGQPADAAFYQYCKVPLVAREGLPQAPARLELAVEWVQEALVAAGFGPELEVEACDRLALLQAKLGRPECIEAARRAVSVARRSPDVPGALPAAQLRLGVSLCDFAWALPDELAGLREAEQALTAASAAPVATDPDLRGRALTALGRVLTRVAHRFAPERFGEAVAALERAIAELQEPLEVAPAAAARRCGFLVAAHMTVAEAFATRVGGDRRRNYDETVRAIRCALETNDQLPVHEVPPRRVRLLLDGAQALIPFAARAAEAADSALELLDGARRLAVRLGESVAIEDAAMLEAVLVIEGGAGDVGRALGRLLAHVRRTQERTDWPIGWASQVSAVARGTLQLAEADAGTRCRDLLPLLERAIPLLRRHVRPDFASTALFALGVGQQELGRWREAQAAFREALAEGQRLAMLDPTFDSAVDFVRAMTGVRGALAEICLQVDDPIGAVLVTDQARAGQLVTLLAATTRPDRARAKQLAVQVEQLSLTAQLLDQLEADAAGGVLASARQRTEVHLSRLRQAARDLRQRGNTAVAAQLEVSAENLLRRVVVADRSALLYLVPDRAGVVAVGFRPHAPATEPEVRVERLYERGRDGDPLAELAQAARGFAAGGDGNEFAAVVERVLLGLGLRLGGLLGWMRDTTARLMLSPHAPARLVPWAAVRLGGAGEPRLVEAFDELLHVPSLATWALLARRPGVDWRVLAQQPVAFVGHSPSARPLDGYEVLRSVATSQFGAAALVIDQASVADLDRAAQGAAMLIVAAHGAADPAAPALSGLELASGLCSVLDLLGLDAPDPRLLLAASCEGSASAATRGGYVTEEYVGVDAAALVAFSQLRGVCAAPTPVFGTSAASILTGFCEQLAAGRSPAGALVQSQRVWLKRPRPVAPGQPPAESPVHWGVWRVCGAP
jgi:tetratricopeptide (TPR) repeat protein